MSAAFFLNSIMFGLSLAVDGFVITLIVGVSQPNISHKKVITAAAIFSLFQAVAPMLGWVCVHTVLKHFDTITKWLNWIAFGALLIIGLKMIISGGSDDLSGDTSKPNRFCGVTLVLQAMATSVDSLSAGFVNADYNWLTALTFSLIIATVTFCACLIGPIIGRRLGRRGGLYGDSDRLLGRRMRIIEPNVVSIANLLGGIMLIFISLEIVL